MFEIALIIIAAFIAGVVALAAMQPSAFRVERSTVVKAPPEKVFPLINDLRAFNSWNPFMKMDPEAKVTYSGAAEGKGAAYAWEGAKTGSGRMEITEAAPSKVLARLDFYKPFAANNVAEFTVDGRGDERHVGDGRPQCVHAQADGSFFQHGQDGRQEL